MIADSRMYGELAKAFAFLGNSLLAPMNQTERHGIDPAFWRAFPDFGDAEVAKGIARCSQWAVSKRAAMDEDELVKQVSVEYTRLFIGPPRPIAPPWETLYRDGAEVGFGEATFAMQRLLREAGLVVSNENNQYADHIGIEILYLSVLCERASRGGREDAQACVDFAMEHPLAWIDALARRVSDECPQGYYTGIILLAESLMRA